eukprot:scaffold7246_cov136-Skeletonema_marinoi.AAC.16
MGHKKQVIDHSQRQIRYGVRVVLAAILNWTSSGYQRRCSDADTTKKSSSRDKDASILSWPTTSAAAISNWAPSSHLRRYTTKKSLSRDKDASILSWPTTSAAAISNSTSSGHLRRCSDADTTNQYLSRDKDVSILSWPTVMGH